MPENVRREREFLKNDDSISVEFTFIEDDGIYMDWDDFILTTDAVSSHSGMDSMTISDGTEGWDFDRK